MNITHVDPQVLGQRLCEARKARGITQEQAAAHLGMSRPTFIATEKGTRRATPEEVNALAELYGRSIHELVRKGPPAVELEPHLRAAIGAPESRAASELGAAVGELQRFANDYLQLESLVEAEPSENYPREVNVPRRNAVEFAEDVASRERARLNLGDQPISDLRRLLEDAVGLRIFFGTAPSIVAGMYAHVASLGYCVLINAKHPRERQRWTLAHEYWHFLADRHKSGIDYTHGHERQPQPEKCADAFARAFLMPVTAVRRQFLDVTTSRDDFQVADLVRLSVCFGVSVQAMTFRLEGLGLIAKGTWDTLQEQGFKPEKAKRRLQIELTPTPVEPYPERYKFLAVEAYSDGTISEGEFAKFLRTDRVSAREIALQCQTRSDEVAADGSPIRWQAQFEQSLLAAGR